VRPKTDRSGRNPQKNGASVARKQTPKALGTAADQTANVTNISPGSARERILHF